MSAPDRDPFALASLDDPIMAMIAEEERARSLSVAARTIAEGVTLEESDPVYAETHRLEGIADKLFDLVIETPTITLAGAIAKLEFVTVSPADFAMSVIDDLRRLAFGDSKTAATAEQAAEIEFESIGAEDGAAMVRDFSAKPWAEECREHGIALRLATGLMLRSKEELLVEGMVHLVADEGDEGKGNEGDPLFTALDMWQHSRERFLALAKILRVAETRQLIAASAYVLRGKEPDSAPTD